MKENKNSHGLVAVFWFLSTFCVSSNKWAVNELKSYGMAWHGREKEQLSCIHFIRFNLMICEWRIFLWAEFLIRHSRAKIENWMLSFTYCVLLLWNDWSFQRKQKFLARLIKSPLYVHFRAGINWFITFFIRFCIYCSASNFTVMYEIIMMIDGIFYEMTMKKKKNYLFVPYCINPWESQVHKHTR